MSQFKVLLAEYLRRGRGRGGGGGYKHGVRDCKMFGNHCLTPLTRACHNSLHLGLRNYITPLHSPDSEAWMWECADMGLHERKKCWGDDIYRWHHECLWIYPNTGR